MIYFEVILKHICFKRLSWWSSFVAYTSHLITSCTVCSLLWNILLINARKLNVFLVLTCYLVAYVFLCCIYLLFTSKYRCPFHIFFSWKWRLYCEVFCYIYIHVCIHCIHKCIIMFTCCALFFIFVVNDIMVNFCFCMYLLSYY